MDFTSFYTVIMSNIERDMAVALRNHEGGPEESLAIGRGQRGLGRRLFDVARAGRRGDFLKGIDLGIDIVSSRVVSIFRSLNVTGCSYFPVEVNIPEDGRQYFGLAVSSRTGPKIEALSRLACHMQRGRRGEVWSVRYGLFFDPNTWDGSDVFFLGDGAVLAIHRRILNALKEQGIKLYSAERLDLALFVTHSMVDLREYSF